MADNKLGIDNIKLFVVDAITLVAGAKELVQRGKKPNILKKMLAGAKAIDLGYDLVEIFPKVKAEIADLNPNEVLQVIDFVKTSFGAEGSDADVKLAIGLAIDSAIATFQSVSQVAKLLKLKQEEDKAEAVKG